MAHQNFPHFIGLDGEKLLKTLSDLEAMAVRAADDAYKGRGRPKGESALPWNFIHQLAQDYRKSTGLKPGRGRGPFSRFVDALFQSARRDQHPKGHFDRRYQGCCRARRASVPPI